AGFESRDGSGTVVGMDALPPFLRVPVGHAVRVAEDAQSFLRPAQAVLVGDPFPGAQLGNPLGAVQSRLALAQGLLRLLLIGERDAHAGGRALEPRGGGPGMRSQPRQPNPADKPDHRQPGMFAVRYRAPWQMNQPPM